MRKPEFAAKREISSRFTNSHLMVRVLRTIMANLPMTRSGHASDLKITVENLLGAIGVSGFRRSAQGLVHARQSPDSGMAVVGRCEGGVWLSEPCWKLRRLQYRRQQVPARHPHPVPQSKGLYSQGDDPL